MSSNYNMNDAHREGEFQLLTSLGRITTNDLSADGASLENEKNRFAPFPTDMTGAVNKLSDKRLITRHDH